MSIAPRRWPLALLLIAAPLQAAQVTCQDIAPFATELAPDPNGEFLSANYNVTGFDYYVLYIALGTTNTQIQIDTFQGSDPIPGGWWTRSWTSASFLSFAHDEHRLVTPAELVTKSPVQVRLLNLSATPLEVWNSQICFGTFGAARSAESWTLDATVTVTLLVVGAAVFVFRRPARSRRSLPAS